MDLKLLKMLCKDSKQHHVMFHKLDSDSSLLCIAQNVRFEIPYKVLYFKTLFLIIFKYHAWVSCDGTLCKDAANLGRKGKIHISFKSHEAISANFSLFRGC